MKTEEIAPFTHIWNRVIQPVFSVVESECDSEFRDRCSLVARSSDDWRKDIYPVYQKFRKQLKDICYGPSEHLSDEELLDGRKIAAVLCAALICKKGFQFQTTPALLLAEEKKKNYSPVAFNQWAVRNIYINYKLAYYASLQMVYLTLMYDLLEKTKDRTLSQVEQQEAKELAVALREEHHLCPYSQPLKGDGFDVNIIIGLARTDLARRELDTFLFAMQLYQIESHTIDVLRSRLS